MKKYKIGFICGFFDILHLGHIEILKEAKNMCEYLIVGVGTDRFMVERKKHEAVLPYEQRSVIVQSIQYVDEVVPEEDLDKVSAYHKYHFDVMFAGEDHKEEPVYVEAEKELNRLGVETVYISRVGDISSTNFRKRAASIK